MKTPDHYARLLALETAHFDAHDRRQLALMQRDAASFVAHCPAATAEAITIKLLTLHDGAERWVRQLVAKAALEAFAPALAA